MLWPGVPQRVQIVTGLGRFMRLVLGAGAIRSGNRAAGDSNRDIPVRCHFVEALVSGLVREYEVRTLTSFKNQFKCLY